MKSPAQVQGSSFWENWMERNTQEGRLTLCLDTNTGIQGSKKGEKLGHSGPSKPFIVGAPGAGVLCIITVAIILSQNEQAQILDCKFGNVKPLD